MPTRSELSRERGRFRWLAAAVPDRAYNRPEPFWGLASVRVQRPRRRMLSRRSREALLCLCRLAPTLPVSYMLTQFAIHTGPH